MNKMILATLVAGAATVFSFASCSDDGGSDGNYVMSNSPRTQSKNAKRGVGFSFTPVPDEDMPLLGPSISWFYNWGPDCATEVATLAGQYGLKYFPMAWNASYDVDRITKTAGSTICGGCLLAFNEPNLTDQANMTPKVAAEKWPALKELANKLGLKITAPAMNYGTLAGYSDPVKWLDEFFELVPLSDVDVIALHCYMNSAAGVKGFIDKFDKYGKPIWLTEFCAWDGGVNSVDAQIKYMSETLAYLDACPKVERYAWFIPRHGSMATNATPYMQLLTKGSPIELTTLGKIFTQCSTQDADVYAVAGQRIQAEHYVRCNASEGVETTSSLSAAPTYRLTTDPDGGDLDICNIGKGKWVEYQVEMASAGSRTLTIRYNATVASGIEVTVDGEAAQTGSLASGDWTEIQLPVNMSAGKHSIRITTAKGLWAANWLSVQ